MSSVSKFAFIIGTIVTVIVTSSTQHGASTTYSPILFVQALTVSPAMVPSKSPTTSPTLKPTISPTTSPSYQMQTETIIMVLDLLALTQFPEYKYTTLEQFTADFIKTNALQYLDDLDYLDAECEVTGTENLSQFMPNVRNLIEADGNRILAARVQHQEIDSTRNLQTDIKVDSLRVFMKVIIYLRSEITHTEEELVAQVKTAFDTTEERKIFLVKLQESDSSSFWKASELAPRILLSKELIVGPLTEKNIVMRLQGLGPLDNSGQQIFKDVTELYIFEYYNSRETTDCDICLQKVIDIVEISCEIGKQDPPSFNYILTILYKKNSSSVDPAIEEIVREPFNTLQKRATFKNLLKQYDEFKDLELVLAPSILEPKKNFTTGIIVAIASGGVVVLVLVIFLICKCSRNGSVKRMKSIRSQRSNVSHLSNGIRVRHPSKIEIQNLDDDEVSTFVDPKPQYGVYNDGKSLGFMSSEPSVVSDDPDYVGIYKRGGTDDPSLVSSVGASLGSHAQKSKFSTMESAYNQQNFGLGPQSVYTDDEQSFEQHLLFRKNGRQREEYIDIYAPKGRLGVIIDTPNGGVPVVHNVKDTCPIIDQLRMGDKLIAVDDEDVRSMTAVKVSRLISQKSNNSTRKFTIARAIDEVSP